MRLFFALAVFLSGIAARAQFTVSGTVLSDKGEPLAGCHIHSGNAFALTDAAGRYSIVLPKGQHQFVVSFVGFETIVRDVEVLSNDTLDFTLKTDVSELQEIVVQSSSVPKTTVAKTDIKVQTIESYSNASLGDLVREVSGVSSLKTGSTVVKPVINGLHSSRVLVINNNVRLEDQQWGLEHAPNLDVNSAGKVSVIKGASGLQYGGDAVGGVILVEPAHIPVIDTIYGRAILNGASNGRGGSSSASLFKGYNSGWNWQVQGTFKYMGDLEAPGYVLSNTGVREKDFSAGFGYQGENSGFSGYYSFYDAEIGILRASHTGNITDLVNSINSQRPAVVNDFTHDISNPKQVVRHHLAKLNYYRKTAFGKLSAQYSFQFNNRLEYDVRRGENRDRAALDLDLFTHSVQVDFESGKIGDFSYKAGIVGAYQSNTASIDTGVRPLIPDYEKLDAGAYAIGNYRMNERLQLELGTRYDFSHIDATKFYLKSRWTERGYDASFQHFIVGDFGTQWKVNPVFSYHNLSASAGSRYAVSDRIDWIVNLSLARRNPNPSELFSDGLHHATGQIELGDLRMKQETAFKASTTVSFASDQLSVEVNPYVNLIRDFSYLQPIGLEYTIRGAFPVWEYRQTNARLSGIDLTADWNVSEQWNYRSTFAYVYAKDEDSGKPLIDIPGANWNNSVRFHKKEWHELSLGLKHEIAFFQNRYPDNDFTADVLADGNPVPTEVQISRPPKGYNLLHFSSEMVFEAFGKSKLTVSAGIQNIFNTAYRDYLNRMRFYADDLGRNFTLQLKLNF